MSNNLSGFNAETVQPNEGFNPLPAGDYPVVITESELKTTKAGTGKYLSLKLQVLDGKYQNRILFDNLNIQNPSEVAQQIGQGTLSAICRAVGVMTPQDSSELHNKPLMATVKIENDQNGNPRNAVKGYKPRNAQAASETAQASASNNSSPF
jgi:hypothetical protein